jgi:uncharacterized membrane protein YjgN (DUF898 family)
MNTLPSDDTTLHKYPVSFTGTGSEYFKIWLINLLLIMITFGLYYPWATVRKNRYIYNNTILDDTPFDYLGTGLVLGKGMLISLVLLFIYNGLVNLGNFFALIVCGVLFSIAMPWLIWKSLRFRLSITTYRAIPFEFSASLKNTYKMLAIPTGILVFSFVLFVGAIDYVSTTGILSKSNQNYLFLGLLLIIAVYVCLLPPFIHHQFKHYQHQHLQWTGIKTNFHVGFKSFLKTWAVTLLPTIFLYGLIAATSVIVAKNIQTIGKTLQSVHTLTSGQIAILITVGVVALYGLFILASLSSKALSASRFQNLIWNHTTTQNNTIHFISTLKFRYLIRIYLKNFVLVLITFGLYWPFAVINIIRLKLSSLTVVSTLPLSLLATQHVANKERNAAGDSVANLFDIDLSL